MLVTDLPDCMIEQIFEYLSYDEIAKQRIICKKINQVCMRLLNIGFNKMMKRHANFLRTIKSQLPRRESERRNHPLAKHADILTCIETRMSMLSMTYTKYMDVNLCCFIPGKVIDEVFNILNVISKSSSIDAAACSRIAQKPLRAHEVLQELRDISSMAIDHFDEKISPILKKAYCEIPSRSLAFGSSYPLPLQAPNLYGTSHMSFLSSPEMNQLNNSKYCNSPSTTQLEEKNKKMERRLEATMKKLNRVIMHQNKQSQQLRDNSIQMNEMNSQIVDLRRRLEESTNSKSSIEQIASTSPAVPSTSSNPPASSSSSSKPQSASRIQPLKNIKPRAATIILKRLAEEPIDMRSKKLKQKRLN